MTGLELGRLFGVFCKTVAQPRVYPDDPVATLYGLDEVVVNLAEKTVLLPELGLATCPSLESVRGAEWFATIPTKDGIRFAVGVGNPYDSSAQGALPQKNGVVTALPYSVLRVAADAPPPRFGK